MGRIEMLPMNGGEGDVSYANNSSFQQKALSMAWPITKEAITELYSKTFPVTLTIADLGCSSGPNSFMVVSNLIKQIETIRQKFHKNPLEYQIFLNDLPYNDFNTVFKALPKFLQDLKNTQIEIEATEQQQQQQHVIGPCLFAGVPGSFYDRLFIRESVHFFHSSYSLHWLSQIPEGIEIFNKGNVYVSRTSPRCVVEAYYKQFKNDFSMFLKHRAEELISGGSMVLTILGRTSEDLSTDECCDQWQLLASALNDMVSEGSLKEEKVDFFNLPIYTPSPSELKAEIFKEGSFTINRDLQISTVDWNFYNTDYYQSQTWENYNGFVDSATYMAKCIRAVTEPLVVRHFGTAIDTEILFSKFKDNVAHRMFKNKIENVNITVSLNKI